jgi:ketosteroid isomerase-like protein
MIALIALAALQTASASAKPVAQILRENDQALLDAIAPGNRALWDKLLTQDAVYVDENGVIMHREEFLKTLTPLPAGASGSISITSYEVNVHGNVALVVHMDDERENYHGIPLKANYLMTETWLKKDAEWRLAMVHAYVVAKDPPAVTAPVPSLIEYEGRYRAAADLEYVIHSAGDHLIAERRGRPSVSLSVEAPDVFFVAGEPRSRKIFRRDAQHHIVDFVDRREGEDLVYVRATP